MISSPAPAATANARRIVSFRIPPEEEKLLTALMAKLECKATDVVLKGIRRLAELEGLRTSNHRPKRSS